jgi:hypothetical protein
MNGWMGFKGFVGHAIPGGLVGHAIPHFEETALDANASAQVPVPGTGIRFYT